MAPPAKPSGSTRLTLASGETLDLVWDKAAMCRADDCGLFATKGVGFARAVKYVWSMLPAAARGRFPSHEDLANALPPVAEIGPVVDAAIAAAGEGMSAKNVFGSTSGRLPSSS